VNRSQRIQRIAQLSRRSELSAAGTLSAAQRELEQCTAQLQELTTYREEYRASLRSGSAVAMNGAQVQKIRAFISQIDTVIDSLNVKIRQCTERQNLTRAMLIKTQRRANALDAVADRERRQESSDAESREQREIDDRAPLNSRG
jgi:flagellar export protein FliJ